MWWGKHTRCLRSSQFWQTNYNLCKTTGTGAQSLLICCELSTAFLRSVTNTTLATLAIFRSSLGLNRQLKTFWNKIVYKLLSVEKGCTTSYKCNNKDLHHTRMWHTNYAWPYFVCKDNGLRGHYNWHADDLSPATVGLILSTVWSIELEIRPAA